MKKIMIKYLLLTFFVFLGISVCLFFSAHGIIYVIWLYSQGVMDTIFRLMFIHWLSIPIFGLFFGLLSLIHLFSASEKEKQNKKYLLFKTVLITISCIVIEYFLQISQSFIYLLFSGLTGKIDPLTHLDMSFYLFWLPFLKKISIFFVFYCFLLTLLRIFYPDQKNLKLLDKIILLHGLFFLAILITILRFEYIKYNTKDFYIGYLDIYGSFIPFVFSMFWLYILSILFVLFIRVHSKIAVILTMITFIYLLIFNVIWPFYLKRFVYIPNQSSLEEKFAGIHAESTRKAFALDEINRDSAFLISKDQILDVLQKNFWEDGNHFLKVIQYDQEIFPIFNIKNTYPLLLKSENGEYDPYFIATRDIDENPNDLWDIKHLRKIFGYGAIIGQANYFDKEGFPNLILKGLELTSARSDISLKNPQIFFGESYGHYALINTKILIPNFQKQKIPLELQTFENVRSISVNSIVKILLSIVLKDTRFIFTDYFTPQTRLILIRKPSEIAKKILPKFYYSVPRLIYHNQELWWEMDGYSTSSFVVTAKKADTPWGKYNWLRASLKVYISAYSGEVIFEVADEMDPHARIAQKLYPKLFDKKLEISPNQFLYPADLFDIQTHLLSFYHELDPATFYSGLHKRQIAQKFNTDKDESIKYRFLLDYNKIAYQKTYTPMHKNIFSAQVTAYLDDNKKKKIHLYESPPGLSIPGLAQSESFLNQDTDFSRLATLWGQRGSRISFSDAIFYPLNDGGIYLKTIFLESESIGIPLAARFVLIDKTAISLSESIEEMQNNIFKILNADDKKTLSFEQKMKLLLLDLYQYYLDAEKSRINGNSQEYRKNVDKIGEALKEINV